MNDRELAERAKQGDQEAFERLVLNNQNRVYTLALRLVNDREEAADLAQEAFVKAWQGLGSFQGESSFATWIYRLTTNACIDWLRKQKRRESVEPAVSLDDEDSGWAEPAGWDQDPQLQLERRELGQALARALDRLPEWQRRVLTLRELSGLSYQEIGEALELDLGTVKSRISRARLTLRKILAEDGNLLEHLPSKHTKGKERG
ncbi:MAG: sigma-70 family RNA polymerase sigma factor [Lawsonibacter sp.]|nr:sigma-70 family RNA polymerase sigma factor [Lawsonibacter sp.]